MVLMRFERAYGAAGDLSNRALATEAVRGGFRSVMSTGDNDYAIKNT